MKVFKFSRNGASYTVVASSKEIAKEYLLEEKGVDIPNCFEVPESEWDEKNIVMFVDNDANGDKFYTSIREHLCSGPELIATSDKGLLD